MILYINFTTPNSERVRAARIKNKRIESRKDVKILEQILKKKLNEDKVTIINWKIIGTMEDKIGNKR